MKNRLFGLNLNFLKNALTLFDSVGYYLPLNGYSLIPSWWRDRPNETQQPANESKIVVGFLLLLFFRAKVLNLKQGLALNDKSERRAKLLLSTFPQRWKGFLFATEFVLHYRFFLFHC